MGWCPGVLIFALPALYNLGLNVYVKLEEIKENKNVKDV